MHVITTAATATGDWSMPLFLFCLHCLVKKIAIKHAAAAPSSSIFESSMLIFGADFFVPDRIWYEKLAPIFGADFRRQFLECVISFT